MSNVSQVSGSKKDQFSICKDPDYVFGNFEKVPTRDLMFNPLMELPSKMEYSIIGQNKMFCTASKNYQLVTPKEVNDAMVKAFKKAKMEVETIPFMDTKGNWRVRYTLPEQDQLDRSALKNGHDSINPFSYIGGSISQGSIFNSGVGSIRQICTNGMVGESLKGLVSSRHTIGSIDKNLGLNFEQLVYNLLSFYENFDQVTAHQKRLQDMKVKKDQLLPMFYELTKGTKFPQSKFQEAYERIQLETKELGYTALNRYLAYAGLNYILEHDTSVKLDLNERTEIDIILGAKIQSLDMREANKSFNELVQEQAQRTGNSARGKQKILELV